jgi:hypothetical protein
LLGDDELRRKLREATSSSALYRILIDSSKASATDQLKIAHGN